MSKDALRQYKATVTVDGHPEEVPVWAEGIEQALDKVLEEYGDCDRLREVRHE
ncbi:host cell RNA polymerase inhibitor [Pseudomonas guariconensis]|uniref:host cell RNA polymerase inhibitor n=1 Tax=Pseudomonas guariconensis TaxID=1288410 RepID=UPI002B05D467|nr:host cell RNA polymerase inhibitor [Pseudomonas guariconensis]